MFILTIKHFLKLIIIRIKKQINSDFQSNINQARDSFLNFQPKLTAFLNFSNESLYRTQVISFYSQGGNI